MKKLLPLVCLLSFNTFASECVPAHEYFPFEGRWVAKDDRGQVELGIYSRISPDGKYVLRSYSGKGLTQVTLMELVRGEKNSVKAYNTPMTNEAFPVQGSWRYLVDVNGDHYKVSDLKKLQKGAKRQFKGGISGFYTVSAELPGGTARSHKIRSLAWPTESSEQQGVGVLSNRVITASLNSKGTATLTDKGKTNYMCRNLNGTDGSVMSLPMISLDGSEFASMPQNPRGSDPSIRIYRFGSDHKTCQKVLDTKVAAAKVTFSRPELNAVLFYASGSMGNSGNGVHFFDRDLKVSFGLNDPNKKVQADSFPGFTNDGRILYGAHWEECGTNGCVEKGGYVISDPYQTSDILDFKKNHPEKAKKFKACITKADVEKVSKEQEKIWSYRL